MTANVTHHPNVTERHPVTLKQRHPPPSIGAVTVTLAGDLEDHPLAPAASLAIPPPATRIDDSVTAIPSATGAGAVSPCARSVPV